MIRAFDFSRAFLLLFFFAGFLLIATEGLETLSWTAIFIASGASMVLALLFACFDWLSHHFSLRALNVFIVGSLLGYLFSLTFISCLSQLTQWTPTLLPHSKWISGLKFSLLLFGVYFGISLVSRASDELYMSIPLVRFRFYNTKKRDLLVDKSALFDTRLLDLAGCGLFDHHLVIPRYLLKELQESLSHSDEGVRQKARRALDLVNSLEMLPRLNLRFYDTDFPEVREPMQKMLKIARNIDSDLIISTVDPNAVSQIEEVRLINLHALASALHPPLTVGELTQIKVRKVGKEPSQGIGFLDDGSMVVINGAGQYIGQTVRCSIISIKRSLNGRLIFANLADERAQALEQVEHS